MCGHLTGRRRGPSLRGERISRALPSSVLRVFPGCSHSILWEATAEVRDAVVSFVAERVGPG